MSRQDDFTFSIFCASLAHRLANVGSCGALRAWVLQSVYSIVSVWCDDSCFVLVAFHRIRNTYKSLLSKLPAAPAQKSEEHLRSTTRTFAIRTHHVEMAIGRLSTTVLRPYRWVLSYRRLCKIENKHKWKENFLSSAVLLCEVFCFVESNFIIILLSADNESNDCHRAVAFGLGRASGRQWQNVLR